MPSGGATQSQLTLTSQHDNPKFRRPPWWNRRTRLERIFCSATVVLFLACVALGMILAVVGVRFTDSLGEVQPRVNGPEAERFVSPGGDCGNLGCQTRGCVEAAASVLENIDESVNPCDDFYHFACGNWIKRKVIPEDKSGLSVFSELSEMLSTKLNVLVEEKNSDLDNVEVFRKIRELYSSCINTDLIEEKSSQPLLDMLEDFGGYPVLKNDWDGTDFNWMDILIKLREKGYDQDILADVSVVTDARNSSFHIIDLDQTDFGMPDRAYYMRGMNDTAIQAYLKLMVESAVLLGADRAKADNDMMEALNFEIALANISLPKEERRNITNLYNKMTIQQLEELSPGIDWLRFFDRIVISSVSADENIIVDVPSFIKGLHRLLETTEKRIIANYMMWRITLQSMSNLDKRFRNLIQDYSESLTGTKTQPPRWKQCIGRLGGCLSTAVAAIYVRNYFPVSSKHAALNLVNAVLEKFKHILKETEWMDEETRQRAIDKANSIVSFIGFPEELLDDNKLNDFCEPLKIQRDNFFMNARSIYKSSVDYSFGQLRKPVDKLDWKKNSKAAVVNAFYNALTNSISFPAGILQGLFFDENRPNYMNYGAIGFIIGHEITHGFDDIGRQFDKDGNNVNWWDEGTNAKFHKKAQCIIKQYGNFTVPEINMKVNGINTQGENIADNGGIKEAYLAYEKYVEDNGPEATLPSLNYTSRQLFWVSAAQIWCSKHRPQALKLRTISGVHSPNLFRVNGVFSNQPYFARDFNCPTTSVMNPANKCTVW